MSSRRWKSLGAALLLLASAITTPLLSVEVAHASVTTLAWPGVPKNYSSLYVHGDSSITVGLVNSGCNFSSATPVDVTMLANGTITDTTYGSNGNWYICGDQRLTVVGSDRATYVVQQNTSTGASRIAAVRDGVQLWTSAIAYSCDSNHKGQVANLKLGLDGKLYATIYWSDDYSCGGKVQLAKLDPSTGNTTYSSNLPSGTDAQVGTGLNTDELMPYSNGLAVVNNGAVYYYGYDLVQQSSLTLTPIGVGSSPTVQTAATSANGRSYVFAYGYVGSTFVTKFLYKDTSSSTINQITPPVGLGIVYLQPAPSGAVLAQMRDSSNFDYIVYYNSSGSMLYQQGLKYDGNATGANRPYVGVDSAGNVITVRMMTLSTSPNDQEVYVDSFNTSGVKTRLFDSEAEFGTAGQDIFTTESWIPQSIGDGKIYLALCHQTSGSASTCANSTATPQIVVINAPGAFDYARSGYFAAPYQYVALGDSYASGEGNPPFLPGTDNSGGDGCDRSASNAYPVLLPLSLRAFVACSGATTNQVLVGKNSERGQLDSLSARTSIVTITVGGDDAGFADFAKECVMGTCDSGSSQYWTTMNVIDNSLQGNLESLFANIRSAAPNAKVVVVGYPEVVVSSDNCPTYLSSGEQIAVETVVTSLNNKLRAAVSDSGTGFQFVDPTTAGSPFEGHDLCSSSSYFFGLNIAEHRFSFHPNPDGELAYEELIAGLI